MSNAQLTQVVLADYKQLTPKGRLILAALVSTYGDDGLTRSQIAERLGQARLYPHDDKAIRQLEEVGFVHIYQERLGDRAESFWDYPEGRQRRRSINFYTLYHVHVLNGMWHPFLVPLLREDGLLPTHEMGYLSDIIDTLKSAGGWLKGLIK